MTKLPESRVALPALCVLLSLFSLACQGSGGEEAPAAEMSPREAMLARAAELELDTEYVPPPGDPLHHHTSGFAKILCTGVFITGLDADFVAENIGYFSSPYDERARVVDREIDWDNKMVHLTLADGVVRTARVVGDQGCSTLPIDAEDVYFTPVEIDSTLPDPATAPWPMGDVLPDEPFPAELDEDKVKAAVDAAFEPAEGLTAAFVVTWKGRIIGERYRDGITMHTPLESWSMGKSLTATFMGILIEQGVYDLWQPAPVPEWQGEGDPRARDPHRRHHADVERPALPQRRRPRLRSGARLPRPPLRLHRDGQLVPNTPPPGRNSGRPTPSAATATPIPC